MIVFLDYLCERPFDLVYQEKTVHQYQTSIMNELISVRNEIRESWIDNRIDDGITQILARSEQVAKEHGFSQSIRKQSMKYNLPIMIGLFALSFIVIFFLGNYIPSNLNWLTYVIYMGLILAVCFLPRIINQRLMSRYLVLIEEKGPLLKSQIRGIMERFQKFNQFLIDDIRKILAENNLDAANYPLRLFNPNYENVRILQDQEVRGIRFYIMELLPFDEIGKQKETIEEDEYDEFGNSES